MTTLSSPTPAAAVEAWWQAMQDQDLEALRSLIAQDYVATGNPNGRTTTRDLFLVEAAAFFGPDTVITTWSLSGFEVRRYGIAAVCTYDWVESGSHSGQQFELAGSATDVLVQTGPTWVHAAHHVTVRAHDGATR